MNTVAKGKTWKVKRKDPQNCFHCCFGKRKLLFTYNDGKLKNRNFQSLSSYLHCPRVSKCSKELTIHNIQKKMCPFEKGIYHPFCPKWCIQEIRSSGRRVKWKGEKIHSLLLCIVDFHSNRLWTIWTISKQNIKWPVTQVKSEATNN